MAQPKLEMELLQLCLLFWSGGKPVVSLPPGDVIFAQQAYSWMTSLFTSGITNLTLNKHCFAPIPFSIKKYN